MKPFKNYISEASEARLNRLNFSLLRTEKRLHKLIGSTSPIKLTTFKSENPSHPLVIKHDKLQQVWATTFGKDMRRQADIATKLKEKDPESYRRIGEIIKPEAFKDNEQRINRAAYRLQQLRNMRAPEQLIQHAEDHLSNISVGPQMQRLIGSMRRIERKPN